MAPVGSSAQSGSGTSPSAVATLTTHSTLDPSAPTFTPPSSTSLYACSNKVVLLQTALAEVSNPHDPCRVLRARIVMDSGSQKSYLTQRVKQILSLPVASTQQLSIAAFGSTKGKPLSCESVHLAVRNKSGVDQELDAFVVPHICDPLTSQPNNSCSEMYAHLTDLHLADLSSDETLEVDMLIGSDFYWDFVTGRTIRGRSGPVAVETTLGWVLSGPAGSSGQGSSVSLMTTHTLHVEGITNTELHATLRSFWELESLGIQSPKSDPVSEQFRSTIQMKGGRYEVSLPWRECREPLADNFALSRRRLHSLIRRLRREPTVLREYDAIIHDQRDRGIVEAVQDTDDNSVEAHYLPHHAVIRTDKVTTKLRIVFDASARERGPSLNDSLHVGPKFNQKILEILLRFRAYPIAMVADIEKAFLMISVAPKDRDVLRFLWFDNVFKENPDIVKLRFTRVVFGVSSSPFLLNATVKHHLDKYLPSHPDLVKVLTRSMYVDDVVFGADTEEDAYALFKNSKEVLGHGSFNLRKFVTNSPTLQEAIRIEESTQPTIEPIDTIENGETYVESMLPAPCRLYDEQRVLGVRWNVQQDQLIFSLDALARIAVQVDPTKRNVVSMIGQIYDPLGFLSPITIQFKKLMQELCKAKMGWDQALRGELLNKWNKLVQDLEVSPQIALPRCYFGSVQDERTSCRLYGFCDASSAAYAAVVYLVRETSGRKHSAFVTSKTRVTPLKPLTIPRLELLSAVLLARLVVTVSDSLCTRMELNEPRCFTDSQVSLFWIKGTWKDWKPFVQNRVDEVRRLVPAECWSHCPGKGNPADIPSRGMAALELSSCLMWKDGPPWLNTPIIVSPLPEDMPDQCLTELMSTPQETGHSLLVTEPSTIGQIIDVERFSTKQRLFRTTAYVLKFPRLLRKKAVSTELTVDDVAEAEQIWIKDAQSILLQDLKFPKWKSQFCLYQDECRIWRCGGRLHNADLPFSSRHPVVLPKKHTLSTLIACSAHRRVQHNGVKETLTEIRAKFWILGGRSLVRSLIHRCMVCRRFEGSPFAAPPPPPLPSFRVNESPPFVYTAVDFAGPLYLKVQGGSSSCKVWICLFTCCVTRAIHLELVVDLTTTTFIRCLKRFSARRGLPRMILSDNAKTFKAAGRLMQTIFRDKELKDHLMHSGVEWKFNLEKAPWWGGLFERMVKVTKRCLRKIVGQAKFSYDEMHTAIVEIEAIINSRPLSFLNAEDTEEPLTPSHLLVGRRLLNLPDNLTHYVDKDPDFEVDSESVQKRVRHLANVLNHFWRRWTKEYLLELREAHRQRRQRADAPTADVKPGDIVLIHDQEHPRGFWKMGQVESLIVGRDGRVRGASLRLASKSPHQKRLQRPLQLLYPLEISRAVEPTSQEVKVPEEDQVQAPTRPLLECATKAPTRPPRESAAKARNKVKEWTEQILRDPDYDSS